MPGLAGVLASALLFSAVAGVLWLLGSYHVRAIHAPVTRLPQMLAAGVDPHAA